MTDEEIPDVHISIFTGIQRGNEGVCASLRRVTIVEEGKNVLSPCMCCVYLSCEGDGGCLAPTKDVEWLGSGGELKIGRHTYQHKK